MDQKTVAALAERVSPFVRLGNARRETLSLLVLGLLSARTTNLSVLACERAAPARTRSTYRRLQRFFQYAEPGADWAAPVVAGLAGLGPGPHRLILDRTNWKIGRREVNLLVLCHIGISAEMKEDGLHVALNVSRLAVPEGVDLTARQVLKLAHVAIRRTLEEYQRPQTEFAATFLGTGHRRYPLWPVWRWRRTA